MREFMAAADQIYAAIMLLLHPFMYWWLWEDFYGVIGGDSEATQAGVHVLQDQYQAAEAIYKEVMGSNV